MTNIAYSYIRFSTPDQLKGDSLRRQLDLSERYATEHGLTLDASLNLRDLGLSAFHGTNLERGGLRVFLEAVKSGYVKRGSHLLVESLDRLSRANVMDALKLFMDITDAGITIVTLSDRMVYSRERLQKDFTGLIISLTYMARAHDESATKSRRLQAVWDEKKRRAREKVLTSIVPAWLTVKDGKIIRDEDRCQTVKMIFQMVRSGYGMHLLERTLNERAVPPIGKANRWHRSYLIKIVKSRAVIGEYQPMTGRGNKRKVQGEPVPNYYPAVISEAEFLATQQAIADRQHQGGRKGRAVANVFSGICRCGYCGGSMRYVNKNAITSWQYLVCSKAKSGLGCRHVPWNYKDFESAVLSKLAGLDLAAVMKTDSTTKVRLEAAKAKYAEVSRRRSSLVKLAELVEDVSDVADRIREVNALAIELKDKVEALESEVARSATKGEHFKQFRQLQTALGDMTGPELAEARLRLSAELKRFIDAVYVYADGDEPWSRGMRLAGVKQGRDGRFAAVRFRTGHGKILHGVSGMSTPWPRGIHPIERELKKCFGAGAAAEKNANVLSVKE